MKHCLSSSGSLAFVVRAEYLIQTVEDFEDTKGVIRIQKSTNDRQQDKQRSTKHYTKTKDGVTRTPLKAGGEVRCCGGVRNSCSTSGTCRVSQVANPVISYEWGQDRKVLKTNGTYPWSYGRGVALQNRYIRYHFNKPCSSHIFIR